MIKQTENIKPTKVNSRDIRYSTINFKVFKLLKQGAILKDISGLIKFLSETFSRVNITGLLTQCGGHPYLRYLVCGA